MVGLENMIMDVFARKADVRYAELGNGIAHLRMPKAYSIIGAVCLIIAAPYLIWPLFDDGDPVRAWAIAIPMLIIFGVCGLMCLLYGIRHRIYMSDEQFHVTSAMGRTRSINWCEIQTGHFSSIEQVMLLDLLDGSVVRVSPYLLGAKLFWRTLKERGGASVGDWGLPYAYQR